MHLVETFASSTGLKIEEPYIYESYIPIPQEVKRYISFQSSGSTQPKHYDYWPVVMSILTPFLNEKGIAVVHIGSSDDPIVKGTLSLRGKTSLNQAAYVIKNSILHLGVDSFATHVASYYRKKIVSLYSVSPPSEVGPYWSDEKDVALLSGVEKGEKHSYFTGEHPKTINRIPAEKVAQSVCDLLGIEFNYPYKTVFVGADAHLPRVEMVPTSFIHNWAQLDVDSIIVRMDKEFNVGNLIEQLKMCKCSVITDKEIDLKVFRAFKDNVVELVYYVDESTNVEYIRQLSMTGIPIFLLSELSEKKLNKIKLKYIEIGPIFRKERLTKNKIKELKGKELDNLYYLNHSRIIKDHDVYTSYGAEPIPTMSLNIPAPVVDNPEFWADLDRMIIFEKTS